MAAQAQHPFGYPSSDSPSDDGPCVASLHTENHVLDQQLHQLYQQSISMQQQFQKSMVQYQNDLLYLWTQIISTVKNKDEVIIRISKIVKEHQDEKRRITKENEALAQRLRKLLGQTCWNINHSLAEDAASSCDSSSPWPAAAGLIYVEGTIADDALQGSRVCSCENCDGFNLLH